MKQRHIDPEDWPRCSVCDMPVEKFCVLETEDALELVAECHGDRESVKLPDEMLSTMHSGWDSMNIGPAFAGQGDSNEHILANQRTN